MMNATEQAVLQIIRTSLFDTPLELTDDVDLESVFVTLYKHTILSVTGHSMSQLPLHQKLKSLWKDRLVHIYANNVKVQCVERLVVDTLLGGEVSFAVLKGSTAALYYREPYLRTCGDVDILVAPDDYEKAAKLLKDRQFEQVDDLNYFKHINLKYGGVTVEVHRYFINNDGEDEQSVVPIPIHSSNWILFDALKNAEIVNADNVKTVLFPDQINAIIFLQHIKQHLKKGLGLRQILDWAVFVDHCINDTFWRDKMQGIFAEMGLIPLAVTVTRMCQIYLGLRTEGITWCKDADESLCETLMDYIMECGNFGKSLETVHSATVLHIPSPKHPIAFFKFLQSYGVKNWKLAKEYWFFRGFAWLYQLCRYLKLAFAKKIGVRGVHEVYREGEKRNQMFAQLGINQVNEQANIYNINISD